MMQQINIRLDSEVKRRMELAADDLGLGLNDVFRIMGKKFADTKGFPFYVISDVRDPYNPEYNEKTLQAMRDAKNNKSDFHPTSIDELKAIWEEAQNEDIAAE